MLRRTIILQNQWATDAVFRVLDDEEVKRRNGRFTRADCERLWLEPTYADRDLELLGLMERFTLCYRLADSREATWLAPQLLSPSKPGVLADWPSPSDLVLSFRYSFLPRGLVSRLMVRLNRFVKRIDHSWGHGTVFEHDDTQVLVEATVRGNEISLRARGPERKELLSMIASELEALNDSFQGLKGKVEKWVPCICDQCRKETLSEMFEQTQLTRRKQVGKLTIECRKSFANVNVLALLDGLQAAQAPGRLMRMSRKPIWELDEDLSQSSDLRAKTIRVFLASSEELRNDRDAFELYLRQQNDRLRSQGLYLQVIRWENFLDAMSETRLQDEYNAEVERCDIFGSLFMTKTGEFTEEEFDLAHRVFKETGKPLIYYLLKDAQVSLHSIRDSDFQSLRAFQKKLRDLGHFQTNYNDAEHLKRHFTDQLQKLRTRGDHYPAKGSGP